MPPDQVSIRDVAELAGVSLGTVSNVLNRPSRVAELKRVRVQNAIEQLGFVRNDAARQLKAGHSDCRGFLFLDVRNPFFTDVATGPSSRRADEDIEGFAGVHQPIGLADVGEAGRGVVRG